MDDTDWKVAAGNPVVPTEEPSLARRRNEDESASTMVRRWATRFTVEGNTELLGSWPASFAGKSWSNDLLWMPIPDQAWLPSSNGAILVVDIVADDSPPSLPSERIAEEPRTLTVFSKLPIGT